jgi:hypothetical protein
VALLNCWVTATQATLERSNVSISAVYTRKSTEEGLDQEFNSLDAQRASAEAFIQSQASAGWICLPQRYDDGGSAALRVLVGSVWASAFSKRMPSR